SESATALLSMNRRSEERHGGGRCASEELSTTQVHPPSSLSTICSAELLGERPRRADASQRFARLRSWTASASLRLKEAPQLRDGGATPLGTCRCTLGLKAPENGPLHRTHVGAVGQRERLVNGDLRLGDHARSNPPVWPGRAVDEEWVTEEHVPGVA